MDEKKKIYEYFVNGERIFLKKGFLGWSVINPTNSFLKRNGFEPLDKKTNIRNLIAGSSWWNLPLLIFIVVVILGSIYEHATVVKLANQCLQKLNFPLGY